MNATKDFPYQPHCKKEYVLPYYHKIKKREALIGNAIGSNLKLVAMQSSFDAIKPRNA